MDRRAQRARDDKPHRPSLRNNELGCRVGKQVIGHCEQNEAQAL